MGISLKCGNTQFHMSYRIWNHFRVSISIACISYICNNIQPNCIEIPDTQNTENLLFYLFFFIKNIEILKTLEIIGIYHLLIIPDNKGYYVYNNCEKIVKMIDKVSEYIDEKDITQYRSLFEISFQQKQNIYIS
jgi:hypothetical protein